MTDNQTERQPLLDEVVLAGAKTIFDGPDEEWTALEQETRDEFLSAALRVILLHDDWLNKNGFRITPPGSVQKPLTAPEAVCMLRAAKAFLENPNRAKPKLILPSSAVLGRVQ